MQETVHLYIKKRSIERIRPFARVTRFVTG